MEDSKTLFFFFKILNGMQKNCCEINRQFGHAPS